MQRCRRGKRCSSGIETCLSHCLFHNLFIGVLLKLCSVHNRQEEERRIREEEMLRQREIEEQMRRKREEAYRSGNFMDNVS